jgi:hypothetical protein
MFKRKFLNVSASGISSPKNACDDASDNLLGAESG